MGVMVEMCTVIPPSVSSPYLRDSNCAGGNGDANTMLYYQSQALFPTSLCKENGHDVVEP